MSITIAQGLPDVSILYPIGWPNTPTLNTDGTPFIETQYWDANLVGRYWVDKNHTNASYDHWSTSP